MAFPRACPTELLPFAHCSNRFVHQQPLQTSKGQPPLVLARVGIQTARIRTDFELVALRRHLLEGLGKSLDILGIGILFVRKPGRALEPDILLRRLAVVAGIHHTIVVRHRHPAGTRQNLHRHL